MKLKEVLPYILILGLVIFLIFDKCGNGDDQYQVTPKIENEEVDPLKAKAIDFTKKAGSQLINCCSSNSTGKRRMYRNHKMLKNGRLSIDMYVQWTGATTNCVYTINGELTVDLNGCNPEFRKSSDNTSKWHCAFTPGCASGCQLSECLN